MARVSRVATDATKNLEGYQRELQRKIDYALRNISVDQILLGLSNSLLVSTNSAGKLISVANLANWIAGTTNQITITNDGDGTITISTPQDLNTGASVTFAGLTVGSLSGLLKAAAGVVSAANAGTDYENPLTFSAPLNRTGNTVAINNTTSGTFTTADGKTVTVTNGLITSIV
jgi:hypothetical protein